MPPYKHDPKTVNHPISYRSTNTSHHQAAAQSYLKGCESDRSLPTQVTAPMSEFFDYVPPENPGSGNRHGFPLSCHPAPIPMNGAIRRRGYSTTPTASAKKATTPGYRSFAANL
ncbi:MAG: hypothetical protein IJ043_09025 [Clostridia bacterium]|nr:hypothetical protein [Clostridia bacterium]